MATQTENYKLNKPARSDNVDIDLLNENFDKIDQNLKPPFFLTFTENEDGSYACDTTYEQVCAALEIGYDVIACYDGEHARLYGNLIYKNEKGVMFGAAYPLMQYGTDAYQMSMQTYMLGSDGTVLVSSEQCYLLPPVDADNDGKTVVVSGGTWSLGDMPTAGVSDEQLTEAVKTAITEAKTNGEFDGSDGVSVTHTWNGTVLEVTSASGTSSADLKGDTGDAGYTPVRGEDYYTEADKTDIINEVIGALPDLDEVSY